MSSTEARSTDDSTTGTTQASGRASSAAERLGGPMEGERSPDTARRAETGDDERAGRIADEDEQRTETAPSDADRPARLAGDEQRTGTAPRTDADADRPARLAGDDEQRTETARSTDNDRETDTAESRRTTLIPPERAESYNSRWNELKSEFVDEPLRAVRGANELVGEVLDELEELFRRQRADLEQGLDSEQTSTEDLRQALGRYRSFFDRLLSF
jgi:hypothetical protein